jgi:hypothetical protein
MKTKILTGALIAMMCFTACEKEEDTPPVLPPAPPMNESASTNPVPGDADGVLVAVNSTSGSGLFSFNIGTGVGLFYNGNKELVSAGVVSVNGTELTKAEGNSYYSTPGASNIQGIDFEDDRSWVVAGGNGIPAFSYNNNSTNKPMPTVGTNTSADNVSRSADYTVSVNTLSGADSVLFILGDLIHTAAGNTISHTFKADDIAAKLENGQAAAMVVPYNLNPRQFSGKRIYFINEAVSTKVVNVSE